MTNLSFRKTRIAPTPSGYLHLGNVLSFLITALLAKKAGAALLLRIDDNDRERTQRKYVEDIFNALHFLEIDWQEGPKDYADFEQIYSQVHRKKLYEEALQQLREERLLFACRCTRLQLQNGGVCNCRKQNISLDKPFVSWRLSTDETMPLTVLTTHKNCIPVLLPPSVKAFVVRKKDGEPAYQLCSLIDDEYYGVDCIVRGEDLWESTLAQHYLAKALRKTFFEKIYFYHHLLLKDTSTNRKLSKSAGATSVMQWQREAKTKEDVVRFIINQLNLHSNIQMDEILISLVKTESLLTGIRLTDGHKQSPDSP